MDKLIEECQEYVDLLNSAPNGFGVHIHPVYGESPWMRHRLNLLYGEKNVQDCLDILFAR